MSVILAQPRGICDGMVGAIAIAARAVEEFEAPVNGGEEIAQKASGIERPKAGDARLAENLTEISGRAPSVFRARRRSRRLGFGAANRGLPGPDAVRPPQRHVPASGSASATGLAGHPRVAGAADRIPWLAESDKDVAALKLAADALLAYVTQTTLGFGAIKPIIVALRWRFSGGAET